MNYKSLKSPLNIILLVLFLVFNITCFMAVDRNSHSATDTLYPMFLFFTCSAFWVDKFWQRNVQ